MMAVDRLRGFLGVERRDELHDLALHRLLDEALADADAATVARIRSAVISEVLDPCFCDDLGDQPECLGCQRTRKVLAILDRKGEHMTTGHAGQGILSDADMAIAAALSVAVPSMLAEEAMEKAPGMIDHLRRQGFDVLRREPA